MSKDHSPSIKLLRPGMTSRLALVAAVLALAACDAVEKRAVGTVGYIRGFAGMAAADEPRAALAGRDVLSAGGNAADAAVAMYYTLAVTYPSAASLGGGGSCIIYDRDRKKAEVMEFPAVASTAPGAAATGVPANPRGMFALHAKYGKLRFESLLAEAERLARTGLPVSRALATDLARAVGTLGRDPGARAIFFRPDGSVLREGDTLAQPNLATVIANLRRNTGDFYLGLGARDMVKGVKAAGGTLSLEDLRDYKPAWSEPLGVQLGDDVAYFPPPPSVGAAVAAQLTGGLKDRWPKASATERPHLLAEASARAFAERARWMRPNGWMEGDSSVLVSEARLAALMADYNPDRHVPVSGISAPPGDSPVAAGFAALDARGGGVACTVTTYGLFGIGRVAPGTGIVLSGIPGPNGPPALASVLGVNHNSREAHYAFTATGGGTAPAALAQALLDVVEGRPLSEALAAPRLVHPGVPDAAFVEGPPNALDAAPLQQRGHTTTAVAMPSRVEALHCPRGFNYPDLCDVATDPRGFGLATMAGAR